MKNINLFCGILLLIFSFSAEAKKKKVKRSSRGPASVQSEGATSAAEQARIDQKNAEAESAGSQGAPMCTNYSPPHAPFRGRMAPVAQSNCRANRLLTEAEMTPTGIAAFVNSPENRSLNLTLKDTVCCMPRDWRQQYVVASTSNSAQASDPDNPRIILGPYRDPRQSAPGKSVAFMLDGSGSIEVLDQHQGVSRYSDVSFSQEQIEGQTRRVAHASLASGRCTTCHGDNSNPSPLFSFAPIWQNTFPKFYKPTVCPTEGERRALDDERRRLQAAVRRPGSVASCLPGLDRTIDVTAEEDICDFYDRTVDQDPTCSRLNPAMAGALSTMSDEKAENVRANINNFDINRLGLMTENFEISVIETSHEALAREVVTWADYPKYKYALVGSLVGCFMPDAPRSSDWFPPGELQRQAALIAARRTTSFQGTPTEAGREWATILHSNSQTPDSTLVSNLTCKTTPANFQNECFPDSQCNTIGRMVENLQETLTAARAAEARAGDANKVDAEILRTIADHNWDHRRNWLPMGCGHRNIDPDSYAVSRYLTSIMPGRPDLRNLWSYNFTSGRHNRIVDTLARKLIAMDADLQRVIPNQRVSPCAALKQASKNALASPADAAAASGAVRSTDGGVTPVSPQGAQPQQPAVTPAPAAPEATDEEASSGGQEEAGE
ncbi:MAG: hypothetical protein K0R29_632 [Pseudobdellovibrio sp.]|nr:hypothetical protein [Pseudobdellovibrio sp.]